MKQSRGDWPDESVGAILKLGLDRREPKRYNVSYGTVFTAGPRRCSTRKRAVQRSHEWEMDAVYAAPEGICFRRSFHSRGDGSCLVASAINGVSNRGAALSPAGCRRGAEVKSRARSNRRRDERCFLELFFRSTALHLLHREVTRRDSICNVFCSRPGHGTLNDPPASQ